MPAKQAGGKKKAQAGGKKKRRSKAKPKHIMMMDGSGAEHKWHRVKDPQLGSGYISQDGSGFFDDVGSFFKKAANGVADAGKWVYNNGIKPIAKEALPMVWDAAKGVLVPLAKEAVKGAFGGSGMQPSIEGSGVYNGVSIPGTSTGGMRIGDQMFPKPMIQTGLGPAGVSIY